MIAGVVGWGPTGENWFDRKHDLTIGCNDALKFSRDFDYLVVINSRQSFSKEPERVKLIESSKSKVLTNDDTWRGVNYKRVRLLSFHKTVKRGVLYSSKSSPFVAISHAFNEGATEIICYGCDYQNHPLFTAGSRSQDYELRKLEAFCKCLNEQGCKVYVSSKESAMSRFLPVYGALNIVGACEAIRKEAEALAGNYRQVTAEEHIKRMLE